MYIIYIILCKILKFNIKITIKIIVKKRKNILNTQIIRFLEIIIQ